MSTHFDDTLRVSPALSGFSGSNSLGHSTPSPPYGTQLPSWNMSVPPFGMQTPPPNMLLPPFDMSSLSPLLNPAPYVGPPGMMHGGVFYPWNTPFPPVSPKTFIPNQQNITSPTRFNRPFPPQMVGKMSDLGSDLVDFRGSIAFTLTNPRSAFSIKPLITPDSLSKAGNEWVLEEIYHQFIQIVCSPSGSRAMNAIIKFNISDINARFVDLFRERIIHAQPTHNMCMVLASLYSTTCALPLASRDSLCDLMNDMCENKDLNAVVRVMTESREGCRLLQCVLTSPQIYSRIHYISLMGVVTTMGRSLCQSQYGNYVVQEALQFMRDQCDSDQRVVYRRLMDEFFRTVLMGHVLLLSRDKFASNVVEKAINVYRPEILNYIVKEIVHAGPDQAGRTSLCSMMLDQYANYVLQTIIKRANDSLRKSILSHIKQNASVIARYSFGRKMIQNLLDFFDTLEKTKAVGIA